MGSTLPVFHLCYLSYQTHVPLQEGLPASLVLIYLPYPCFAVSIRYLTKIQSR